MAQSFRLNIEGRHGTPARPGTKPFVPGTGQTGHERTALPVTLALLVFPETSASVVTACTTSSWRRAATGAIADGGRTAVMRPLLGGARGKLRVGNEVPVTRTYDARRLPPAGIVCACRR
jgi:hypothetical protein